MLTRRTALGAAQAPCGRGESVPGSLRMQLEHWSPDVKRIDGADRTAVDRQSRPGIGCPGLCWRRWFLAASAGELRLLRSWKRDNVQDPRSGAERWAHGVSVVASACHPTARPFTSRMGRFETGTTAGLVNARTPDRSQRGSSTSGRRHFLFADFLALGRLLGTLAVQAEVCLTAPRAQHQALSPIHTSWATAIQEFRFPPGHSRTAPVAMICARRVRTSPTSRVLVNGRAFRLRRP